MKKAPFKKLVAIIHSHTKRGEALAAVIPMEPKKFRTKSRGFYGQIKIENHTTGERYQLNVTAVLIGSKPKKKAVKKK